MQDDWPAISSEWYDAPDGHRWTCPACAHEGPVWVLDWHHRAGFGRQAITIWHVGREAASPSEALHDVLQALGAGAWTHFDVRL